MKLLREIIRKLILESTTGRKPKVLFLGGLPGGGKSTVVRNVGLDTLFTTCNLDDHYEAGLRREGIPLDIQTWMSEYSQLKRNATDPDYVMNTEESKRYLQLKDWASKQTNLMFKEALPMFEKDLERCVASGQNVMIDGTSANSKKILKQIADYKEAGYDVGMIMVNILPDTAQERNVARGKKGGRSLPRFAIRNTHDKLEQAKLLYQAQVSPYWEIDNMGTFEEYVEKIAELRSEILDWVHS